MADTELTTPLTDAEGRTLDELKGIVRRGQQTFQEVAGALLRIRDERLWRGSGSPTFQAFCQIEFGFGRRRTEQLIAAVDATRELSGDGADMRTIVRMDGVSDSETPLPENEAQVREVAKSPKGNRAKVWKKAVATAPKDKAGKPKVTAAHVRRVVKEAAAPAPPPPPAPATEPEAPKDQTDRPIADAKVAEAFANGARFDRALSLLAQVAAEINPLLGDANGTRPLPGGEMLAANRQQTKTDLKNLRLAIRFARPFAACPYPHTPRVTCPACKGLGWVVEQTYEGAPTEYKSTDPPVVVGQAGAA